MEPADQPTERPPQFRALRVVSLLGRLVALVAGLIGAYFLVGGSVLLATGGDTAEAVDRLIRGGGLFAQALVLYGAFQVIDLLLAIEGQLREVVGLLRRGGAPTAPPPPRPRRGR